MTQDTAGDLARLSINQETVKQWSLPELAEGCTAPGVTSVGLWRAPVQEYGVARAARLMRDSGLDRDLAVPRRLLHRGRPAAARRRPGRQPRGDRRGRRPGHRHAGAGLRRPARGRPRPRRAPGSGSPTRSARWRPTRPSAACGWRSSRCTRCTPRTVASCPPSPRRWTSPSASPPSRSASSSTPTTCGGTTSRPPRIVRAGEAGRIACFQLADWVTPLPEGVLLGRGQLGDGCVDLRGFREQVDAAGYRGAVEVEIFNPALWARDGGEVARGDRRPVPAAGALKRILENLVFRLQPFRHGGGSYMASRFLGGVRGAGRAGKPEGGFGGR